MTTCHCQSKEPRFSSPLTNSKQSECCPLWDYTLCIANICWYSSPLSSFSVQVVMKGQCSQDPWLTVGYIFKGLLVFGLNFHTNLRFSRSWDAKISSRIKACFLFGGDFATKAVMLIIHKKSLPFWGCPATLMLCKLWWWWWLLDTAVGRWFGYLHSNHEQISLWNWLSLMDLCSVGALTHWEHSFSRIYFSIFDLIDPQDQFNSSSSSFLSLLSGR